jgi:hypothetical protein
MQKLRGFCLCLLSAAFILSFQTVANARGASSAGAGDGPAPSPAANEESSGAGPHSGPPNSTYNIFTGVYTPENTMPDGSKRLLGNLSWPQKSAKRAKTYPNSTGK